MKYLRMPRLIAALTAFLLMLGAVEAHAKRVALVIGNAAYEYVPELANPVNDAEAKSAALQRLGFTVIVGIDVSRLEFEEKIIEFARAIRGADIALLYYAGHGLQVNGRNYLAPVETELQDEASLEFQTVRLESILSQMERERRTNLIFLDACRNNPLARNLARSMETRATSIGQGLAPIESGIGTLISIATQPGNVALDGDTDNSPFTGALIRHIETTGEDIAVLLRRVRQEVIEQTNGVQVPWSNSSLTGKVILKPEPDKPIAAQPTQSDRDVEIVFWKSIASGNSKAYFKIYLDRFPKGEFVDIAKIRIAEIERAEEAEKHAAELKEEQNKAAERRPSTEEYRVQEKIAQDLEAPVENSEVVALVDPVVSKPQMPAIDPKMDKVLARSIQTELNRIGCSVGRVDGIWGDGSRKGLSNFSRHSDIELTSLDPSVVLLTRLKAQKGRVCPLAWGSGFKAQNNKCVATHQDANVRSTGTGDNNDAKNNWAAIVGSSDRSAVGWTTNQPDKDTAINVARIYCRKNSRTIESCNTVRQVWSGPSCKPVIVNGKRRSICNR